MQTERAYFCEICHKEDFQDVVLVENEPVTVLKHFSFQNTHIYHQCRHCGERYEPHDDPDFNLRRDYAIYERMRGKGKVRW